MSQQYPNTIVVGGTKCWLSYPDLVINQKTKIVNVIFLLHGRLATHEEVTAYANQFAQDGFLAVYTDNPNHGDRMIESVRNEAWNKGNNSHAMDMYAQMLTSFREMQTQIDILPLLLGLKFGKIGVYGISQGGHASLVCFTNEPRINVCASMISSADYANNMLIRYEKLKSSGTTLSQETLFPSAFSTVLDAYDPIRNVERCVSGCRPLLMCNGDHDNLVPMESNVKFHGLIEPHYVRAGCQANLSHKIYPGIGHVITPEMMDDTRVFFRQHLSYANSGL